MLVLSVLATDADKYADNQGRVEGLRLRCKQGPWN